MPKSDDSAQTAPPGWIDRYPPPGLRPYLRLARVEKPIGTWLLLWPCWWSIALAAGDGPPDVRLLALFGVGALVMRGAGCTINDIVDRDFDARVARTASRPLPSGAVTLRGAWLFLALQLVAGLAVLLQLDETAIALGVASLPLIAAYPFMKRLTWWPQVWLGLTFNWGALMGWAAATGSLAWPALALYAAGIAWTLGYDTIYAHQDKEDDALIGVKSSARKLGAATRPWLFVFYAVAVGLIGLSGALAGLSWPFYAGLAAAGAQLGWQAARVDIDDASDCLATFKSNAWLGWIVFAAIVAGRVTG
ncbi:MAG: 4-hydroxybenzoate octaprenyltransferase [Alphaproteobacteria bacterium]